MAKVSRARPVPRGRNDAERERKFAESLVAVRLALGGLEAACMDDAARYRLATSVLERFKHEIEVVSAYGDPFGDPWY